MAGHQTILDPNGEHARQLRELLKDLPRLRDTIAKCHLRTKQLIENLKKLIKPRIGIGLLQELALGDIHRATELAVEATASYFPGKARFLRGIIVSHVLDADGEPATRAEVDAAFREMMEIADELWTTMFSLERFESELAASGTKLDRDQVEHAGLAATYGRTDPDIGYVEPVEERCRDVFSGLDSEFVVPTFGLTTAQMIEGFRALKVIIGNRLNAARSIVAGRSIRPGTDQLVDIGLRRRPLHALQLTNGDLPDHWTDEQRRAFFTSFSLEAGPGIPIPTPNNITLRKPFLRISGGRFHLMDPIFCRYAPSRALNHQVRTSRFRDKYLELRDDALEKRTGRIFVQAVSPCIHHAGAFVKTGPGGELAEQDHIVIAGAHAFFIENKAKQIRDPVVHQGNATKVKDDLKASIQIGFDQGNRARIQLVETGVLDLFDRHGKPVDRILLAGIKSAHVIVVTWESIAPLNIDLKPWLTVPAATEYPWVLSVDDLETALSRLRPASEIAGFVSWRSGLNGRIVAGDEMHVVGCFLAKHLQFPSDIDHIYLDASYAAVFDDDYYERMGIHRDSGKADVEPGIVQLAHEGGELVARVVSEEPRKERKRTKPRKRTGKGG